MREHCEVCGDPTPDRLFSGRDGRIVAGIWVCMECYGPAVQADAVVLRTMKHLRGEPAHAVLPWDVES